MNQVIHLQTKEQANTFFNFTGFEMPSCGCSKTNFDYKEETAYCIEEQKFGNVRYYEALIGYGKKYEIKTFSEYMESVINTNVVEFEDVQG